jgi:hypothetical protein
MKITKKSSLGPCFPASGFHKKIQTNLFSKSYPEAI